MSDTINMSQFVSLVRSLESCDVLIRLRLAGEPWMDFSQVLLVSENAMILQERVKGKVILKLSSVVEFEIDRSHLEYAPNVNYRIDHGW